MDKNLVRQWRDRWQAVEAVEAEELRVASIEDKWQQLNAIFRLGEGLGLLDRMQDRDEQIVRERWARLKASYR